MSQVTQAHASFRRWLVLCAWMGAAFGCTVPNPSFEPGLDAGPVGSVGSGGTSAGGSGGASGGGSGGASGGGSSGASGGGDGYGGDGYGGADAEGYGGWDGYGGGSTAGAGGTEPADGSTVDQARDQTSPPPIDLLSGLLGHWPLDQATGSLTLEDQSGHDLGGDLVGLDPSSVWTPGKVGSALEIPNSFGAGVRVAPSEFLDSISSGLTIAAWVYRTVNLQNKHMAVVSRQWGDSDRELFNLAFLTDTLIAWMYTKPPAANTSVRANRKAPLATWIHVALTHDGKMLRLYQDGAEVGSLAYTEVLVPSENPLWIGNNANSPGLTQPLVGRVDDVRLYKRALPPEAIVALMAEATNR